MKRLIYIDESGDPGLTKDTSRYFVMAAVAIDVEENFNLEKKMQDIRRSYGWPPEREFKFNRTRKSIIREVLSGINGLKYSIYIAILDKNKMLNDGKMSKMEIYKTYLWNYYQR